MSDIHHMYEIQVTISKDVILKLMPINMTCESKDDIYVIKCAGCNEYYIGETSNTLRPRLHVHKQHNNTPEYRQINLNEWKILQFIS